MDCPVEHRRRSVIVAHHEGNVLELPHNVDAILRREPRHERPEVRDAVLQAVEDEVAMVGGVRPDLVERWTDAYPRLAPEIHARAVRLQEARGTVTPPPPRPTVAALVVVVLSLFLVECLLVALRVGGALQWSWGWVLAPLWLPVTIATTAVVTACVVLAAMDERDAARRRRS